MIKKHSWVFLIPVFAMPATMSLSQTDTTSPELRNAIAHHCMSWSGYSVNLVNLCNVSVNVLWIVGPNCSPQSGGCRTTFGPNTQLADAMFMSLPMTNLAACQVPFIPYLNLNPNSAYYADQQRGCAAPQSPPESSNSQDTSEEEIDTRGDIEQSEQPNSSGTSDNSSETSLPNVQVSEKSKEAWVDIVTQVTSLNGEQESHASADYCALVPSLSGNGFARNLCGNIDIYLRWVDEGACAAGCMTRVNGGSLATITPINGHVEYSACKVPYRPFADGKCR